MIKRTKLMTFLVIGSLSLLTSYHAQAVTLRVTNNTDQEIYVIPRVLKGLFSCDPVDYKETIKPHESKSIIRNDSICAAHFHTANNDAYFGKIEYKGSALTDHAIDVNWLNQDGLKKMEY
jgi:hypothetical protein